MIEFLEPYFYLVAMVFALYVAHKLMDIIFGFEGWNKWINKGNDYDNG